MAFITGTAIADSITGTNQDDLISGLDGNDTVTGGGGNDIIDDGGGNGDDRFFGEDGNDRLYGEVGNDTLDGGPGNDYLDDGDGNDNLIGGDGSDTLNATRGINTLKGGLGDDCLKGESEERLWGETGNDTLIITDGSNNLLDGGLNNDYLLATFSYGFTGNILRGGEGEDTYSVRLGYDRDNSTFGMEINDASGSDRLILQNPGGTNQNLYLNGLEVGQMGIAEDSNALGIDLNQDGQVRRGDDLVILDFFNAAGDGPGSGFIETIGELSGNEIIAALNNNTTPGDYNIIEGTNGPDNLEGTDGPDSILGNGGNDSISNNGAGDDVLRGGFGNDSLRDSSDSNDLLDGGPDDDILIAGGGDDSLLGGDGNDTLNADRGADTLDGGDGNDILWGNGSDSLAGGVGSDTLFADGSNNTVDGGAGNDNLAGTFFNDFTNNVFRGGGGGDVYSMTLGLNRISQLGLTIEDTAGNDTLILKNLAGTDLSLSPNGLEPDKYGLARTGSNLAIDLNADGQYQASSDLTIVNFFNAAGNGAGTGFIETVGTLSGNEIVAANLPASPWENLVFGIKSAARTGISYPPAHLFSFDENSPRVTDIGAITLKGERIDADGLAISRKYGLLGFEITPTRSTLISINPDTAVATAIGETLRGKDIRGAAFDRSDNLWVVDAENNELLQIDPEKGSVLQSRTMTLEGESFEIFKSLTDLAIAPDGTFYLTNYFPDSPNGSAFFTLEPETGVLTYKGFNDQGGLSGLTFSQIAAENQLFAYEIRAEDDIFIYDTDANYKRQRYFSDILPRFNSGRGDLAALLPTRIPNIDDTSPGGINIIRGTDSADTLAGSDAPDSILGFAGNDSISSAGDGNDTVEGGIGNDTVADAGPGNDLLKGGGGNDSLEGGDGDDRLFGNAGSDVLFGGSGANKLYGGGGNDSLWGNNNDTLVGGAGSDTLMVTGSNNNVRGNGGSDFLAVNSFESFTGNVLNGYRGNDTYTISLGFGSQFGVEIKDRGGTDALVLNDLFGASPTLSLSGLAAGTIGVVRENRNLAIDLNQDGQIKAADDLTIANFFNASGTDRGFGFIETVAGISGNSILRNLAPSNVIVGNRRANRLDGTSADERFEARGGNDRVFAGGGDDTLIGGSGSDILRGQAGSDFIEGGFGSDRLIGNVGNDLLVGNAGSDRFIGGAGDDFLVGNAGSDGFIFKTNRRFRQSDLGVDTIADFNGDEDNIILDRTTFRNLDIIDGNGLAARDFAVVNTNWAAARSAASIVYNQSNGSLFYNSDGTDPGFGIGDRFATLQGQPSLDSTDFIIAI